MAQNTNPVSYTHLGVYKRQIQSSDNQLVYAEAMESLLFNNIALDNITFSSVLGDSILLIKSSSPAAYEINNITTKNSQFENAKGIVWLQNSQGNLNASTIIFENVTATESSSFFKLSDASVTEINSLSFTNWNPASSTDVSSILLDLRDLAAAVSNSITFNGIESTSSTLPMLRISNNLQSKDIDQYLSLIHISPKPQNPKTPKYKEAIERE